MHVKTRQQMIENVATQWREAYFYTHPQPMWYSGQKREIYERLVSLVNPTTEDINRVIGNGSWTRLTCNECGREVEGVIQLGQSPDYESAIADICFDCLRKAIALTTPVEDA